MLIILEGLDRTGKSTLAAALADHLRAPLIHKGAPTQPDALSEYLSPLAGYGPGSHLVLDRWHWGEVVWPAVFGRHSLVGEREFDYIELALAHLDAKVVYCTGNPDTIWHRCVRDQEPIVQRGRDVFHRAHMAFEDIAAFSRLPIAYYDFTAQPTGVAISRILSLEARVA